MTSLSVPQAKNPLNIENPVTVKYEACEFKINLIYTCRTLYGMSVRCLVFLTRASKRKFEASRDAKRLGISSQIFACTMTLGSLVSTSGVSSLAVRVKTEDAIHAKLFRV